MCILQAILWICFLNGSVLSPLILFFTETCILKQRAKIKGCNGHHIHRSAGSTGSQVSVHLPYTKKIYNIYPYKGQFWAFIPISDGWC